MIAIGSILRLTGRQRYTTVHGGLWAQMRVCRVIMAGSFGMQEIMYFNIVKTEPMEKQAQFEVNLFFILTRYIHHSHHSPPTKSWRNIPALDFHETPLVKR